MITLVTASYSYSIYYFNLNLDQIRITFCFFCSDDIFVIYTFYYILYWYVLDITAENGVFILNIILTHCWPTLRTRCKCTNYYVCRLPMSVRLSSVVRRVVTSRTPSKIDPSLLWNNRSWHRWSCCRIPILSIRFLGNIFCFQIKIYQPSG